MPELPEVETSRKGILPFVEGAMVTEVVLRKRRLRYPIPSTLAADLPGQLIHAVERRGKYLLLRTEVGTVIIHLGMSGSLRIVETSVAPEKHDHVDIVLDDVIALRLRDPRRFGALLWSQDADNHPLIKSLGPEPLTHAFHARYLFERSRKRRQAVKAFIMDSRTVVGVGNIYASEALFGARVNPLMAAGDLSEAQAEALVVAIKKVLRAAIRQGGTTLRDFVDGSGRPGYFAQKLKVYGRDGEPCSVCGSEIVQVKQGQRATYYCPVCQS